MTTLIYKIKGGYVASWSNEVKGGKLKYFQQGKGYKTTKVFEVVGEINYANTWRDVVDVYLKYGFEVALESAEYMTAGVVKWAYTNAYIEIFKKLYLAGFSDEFDKAINICPIDYLLVLS